MQTDLFQVHAHENNTESQRHLNANRVKFSAQCQRVFDMLMDGKRLTVLEAHASYGISSLPRRVKDLKDNGVQLEDLWVNGVKKYFMNELQIQHNQMLCQKN